MKHAIIALNNESSSLDARNETKKAIHLLIRASVLYNKTIRKFANLTDACSLTRSATLGCIPGVIELNEDLEESPIRLKHAIHLPEMESTDEGLLSTGEFTKMLSISIANGDSLISNPELEAVLCFNLGVCLLKNSTNESKNVQDKAEQFFKTGLELLLEIPKDSGTYPFHLNSNKILYNLGLLHLRRKKYESAYTCHKQCLDNAISMYGDLSPSVAQAFNAVGVTLFSQLKTSSTTSNNIGCLGQQALKSFEMASFIQARLRKKNYDHDKWIATINMNIGYIKFVLHDYENALTSFVHAYQVRRIDLGNAHIDTAIAAYNAGKCLQCLGHDSKAMNFYEIFTKIVFLPSNLKLLTEQTIFTFQGIAWAFHQNISFWNAEKFYKLALRSSQQVFNATGMNRKIVARILNQLGNLSFECDNLSVALKCYQQGLAIECHLSSSHTFADYDSFVTLSNIANVYENVGRLTESLDTLERMLEILRHRESTKVPNCPSSYQQASETLSNLARVHGKLGRVDLALVVSTEVLDMERRQYGTNDGHVATTLNEIGILYARQGQTLLALEKFEESYKIRKELNDPQRNASTVLFNIVKAHINNADITKAITICEELVQLEISQAGKCDEDAGVLLETLEIMANIYKNDFNNPTKALLCYEKGINFLQKKGPQIILCPIIQSRFLGMTGNLCLRLENIDRAMYFFSKTMRFNLSAGLRFNDNVNLRAYELLLIEKNYPRAAAAA